MNPAAMVTNLDDLRHGGILIANEDGFNEKEFKLAKVDSNPLDANVLEETYRIIKVPMTKLTRGAVAEFGLGTKVADRCKNFFAMGLVYWLFGRSLDPTLRFIQAKFSKKPDIAAANEAALRAGWAFGETTEAFGESYQVEAAELKPGTYRNMMGNQALAWGLIAASKVSNKDLFYGTYPITPASDILHELTKYKHFGVKTFQAEDEIAAVCSTIGAAFGGSMAVTASSGPGIALKAEGMGLGMILELPMIIINVQRGGPSTGLPTKTEQSDLLQGMYGRNGEAPLPILAPRSPADCFDIAVEAWRLAVECMVPVMILSDGYIANGSEPWKIPEMSGIAPITVAHPEGTDEDEPFMPYARDEYLARPWAIPGTPGLMHRVGGLEKEAGSGNVSYDPANHQHMTEMRAAKVAKIAERIPEQEITGPATGTCLLCLGAVPTVRATPLPVAVELTATVLVTPTYVTSIPCQPTSGSCCDHSKRSSWPNSTQDSYDYCCGLSIWSTVSASIKCRVSLSLSLNWLQPSSNKAMRSKVIPSSKPVNAETSKN